MNKKIGLITIHGMGETDRAYYSGLESSIEDRLGNKVWDEVHLEPIYYQNFMQDNEYQVWRNMQSERLSWKKLRQFMLFGFADAATLEHKPDKPGSVYHETQLEIVKALKKTRIALGNQDRDIIIVAQSLGCQVMNNYIWDFQNPAGAGIWKPDNLDFPDFTPDEKDFLYLKTLRYLLTTGCNIPLFVAGFNPIIAIEQPNEKFQWHNYYDKDDVLGWPLKPLSDSYNNVVNQDIEINSGGLLERWNPASHTGYWTDRDFIEPLCDIIKSLL